MLVATQTIEVGVDLDLSCLITELASGSAMAQRAGRVNRSGERDEGPVYVVAPPGPLKSAARSGPYTADELQQSLDWLEEIARSPVGLAPWAIHPSGGGNAPPAAILPRAVLHRPEPWDAHEWARTGDEALVEPWLDLWLSDSLEPDLTAGVVVRAGLPADADAARLQISATPPLYH